MAAYSAAVQHPETAFRDPELRRCRIAQDHLGLPFVWSGNSAAVFKLEGTSKAWAVRVFQKPVTDHEERYAAINQSLAVLVPPAIVRFEYQSDGILVKNVSYPIVKMEWIKGKVLSDYVEENLQDAPALSRLAAQWWGLVSGLEGNGVGHGDLEHGNGLVLEGGDIKLVDYDGMFVPSLAGFDGVEIGHPDYQHPSRTMEHFCREVDLFSATVIYLSLRALAADPHLWENYNNGNNLFLTAGDFRDPARSGAFARLAHNSDPGVPIMAKFLRDWCEHGHPLQAFKFETVAQAANPPYPRLPRLQADAPIEASPEAIPRPFFKQWRTSQTGLPKKVLNGLGVIGLIVAGMAGVVYLPWSRMLPGAGSPAVGASVHVTRTDGQRFEGKVISDISGVLHIRDQYGDEQAVPKDQIASWKKTGTVSEKSSQRFAVDTRLVITLRDGKRATGKVVGYKEGVLSVDEGGGRVEKYRDRDILKSQQIR